MQLPILYQDDDLVIVNKPSGLLVHRTLIDRHETRFAMQMVRDRIGQSVYTVHRLDKPTSGALVFALSAGVASQLSAQFEAGVVSKVYMAIVRGTPPEYSPVDYALSEEVDMKIGLAGSDKPAQSAQTEVFCLASQELPFTVDRYPTARYSLVKAVPKTGRRHQIRRHLRHLGHPIIGDITYGVGKHNRFFETHFKTRRLFLAATEIAFSHPRTGQLLKVKAPLAENFLHVAGQLGWGSHLV